MQRQYTYGALNEIESDVLEMEMWNLDYEHNCKSGTLHRSGKWRGLGQEKCYLYNKPICTLVIDLICH